LNNGHLLITLGTFLSLLWWHLPVVSATWETEARGLLEPRSLVPAWTTQRNSEAKRKTKEKNFFYRCDIYIGIMVCLILFFFFFITGV
jgi:hypothetical protein